jgi:hypothetical protein
MKSKTLITIILFMIFSGSFESCQNNSKENTWSDEQKTKWKTECQQTLTSRGLKSKDANDFCDCMLKKTSQKYTPEEATKITIEEERKLWNECDYQW